MENTEKVKKFSQSITKLKAELAKDVVGQQEIIDSVICAIIAGGNILLEGVPGVGKTRLVRSLGKAMSLPFSRIQFTPDLMPSDVTGSDVIEQDEKGKMNTVFQRGPIFANLVLADEINRATPKTQAAMLEVMQEHKVTVGKQTYKLAEPFFVLATQNPIEQDGTYPLPEAQMDRFMFKLIVNFPSKDELAGIVNMTQITLDETASAVIDGPTILEMRELAKTVPVIDEVLQFAVDLVSNTHPELDSSSPAAKKYLKFGASPRAAQALITCAKVRALMNGNYNVSYKDIKALAYPVLRHRIKLNYNAIAEKLTVDDVIGKLIAENGRGGSIGSGSSAPAATPANTAEPVEENKVDNPQVVDEAKKAAEVKGGIKSGELHKSAAPAATPAEAPAPDLNDKEAAKKAKLEAKEAAAKEKLAAKEAAKKAKLEAKAKKEK